MTFGLDLSNLAPISGGIMKSYTIADTKPHAPEVNVGSSANILMP